jgi:hypothetical protein
VVGSCEYGDESSVSGTTELANKYQACKRLLVILITVNKASRNITYRVIQTLFKNHLDAQL